MQGGQKKTARPGWFPPFAENCNLIKKRRVYGTRAKYEVPRKRVNEDGVCKHCMNTAYKVPRKLVNEDGVSSAEKTSK